MKIKNVKTKKTKTKKQTKQNNSGNLFVNELLKMSELIMSFIYLKL